MTDEMKEQIQFELTWILDQLNSIHEMLEIIGKHIKDG